MQSKANAAGKELSRSTACRIVKGEQPPTSLECLEAFLIACEVPPRDRAVWFEAFLRVQRRAAMARRQEAAEREELERLESVVTDNRRGGVSQQTAVRMLRKAGFDALERYRRFDAPWTVECLQCAATFRIRLSDVVLARATCPDCPKLAEHVREAWAELLTNRSGLLSRRQVRALRAATVLHARLQRDHLDVPVFVADRATLVTLQSSAWHPALEEALRRHVRRPFYLDVLLVHDYDAMPARRNGQRHRRLAKAAGLVHGPLEASPPAAGDPDRTSSTSVPHTGRGGPGIPHPWKPTSNSGA